MGDRALLDALVVIFERDLNTVRRELAAYPDDAAPWQDVSGMPNTGGTLALHLAGNLRHFVGGVLGGTGFVRDRDAEFSLRGLTRQALDAVLDETIREVRAALTGLDPSRLESAFPVPFSGSHVNTRLFLVHLATHLTYHLGQLDAHRRAVTGDATGVQAVALPPLFVSPVV